MGGRDKKKDSAPSSAAFYPLGADLFLSPRKIDHIARFIQIPAINVPGEVPSILIVNLQVPACLFLEFLRLCAQSSEFLTILHMYANFINNSVSCVLKNISGIHIHHNLDFDILCSLKCRYHYILPLSSKVKMTVKE